MERVNGVPSLSALVPFRFTTSDTCTPSICWLSCNILGGEAKQRATDLVTRFSNDFGNVYTGDSSNICGYRGLNFLVSRFEMQNRNNTGYVPLR